MLTTDQREKLEHMKMLALKELKKPEVRGRLETAYKATDFAELAVLGLYVLAQEAPDQAIDAAYSVPLYDNALYESVLAMRLALKGVTDK
jgi:hypothetical protein